MTQEGTMKLATNRELLDFAYTFRDRIRNEEWVPRYDFETDEFSFTVPNLSRDARVRYVDDEIAFYMTPDQKIEGVFIEYFRKNFMQHHEGMDDVLSGVDAEKLDDDEADEGSVVELKAEDVQELIPELEEALKYSLAERMDAFDVK